MRLWPESLVWRLTVWAMILFAISLPALWAAFLAGATRISENVVDTQIIEFATQLRGYRASAKAASRSTDVSDGVSLSAPVLVGDTDWAWQVSLNGRVEARSDLLDLSDQVLPDTLAPVADRFILTDADTPVGRIRVAGRAVNEAPPGQPEEVVRYIVGLDEVRYRDRVEAHRLRLNELVFVGVLPISIGILGMLAFVVLSLRRTFAQLESALRRYEAGDDRDIEGSFPREIRLLVDRTNAILRQNQLLIDRTRKYVSKIAHDINHPLAILKNALRGGEVDGEMASRQIARMTGLIDRYASLARAIGPEQHRRGAIPVRPVLDDIRDGFQIMFRREPFSIDYVCEKGLEAVIPRHDLETILSNLVSNAHKYAQSRSLITASVKEGALQLVVEDDGPGIPEADREVVLNWGNRLDEAPPGTGFGLSIVCDIVDLYSGSVRLDSSAGLGGLKVVVDLPVPASERQTPNHA